VSMGAGPTRLSTDDPLLSGIENAGWELEHDEIEPVDESDPEIVRVIELIRRLAASVGDAVSDGAFPLVFAGNCNTCLGTTAGAGSRDLGVVWFDAHADFDDPEESEAGFFDVMGLAMLTGRGWRALRQTIPGHAPIPERNVILAAIRDLEPYQRRRLERSELSRIPGEIEPGRFEQAVAELSGRVERVYLHVDLDSIDISEARANKYAAPGGPSLDRLLDRIAEACQRFRVVAAAITAYDPSLDDDERTLSAARRISSGIAHGIRG
ncbi:MAG TPA: arginase family protein, partial [Solirubrobacteraceae bacterium]|nr:arginase family protein [Solirubrobacteraceae bacterium]